jgi:hypothetical protein
MKANPNIDELLCSFLDGELPPRQQTEVQRLVAREPEVGRRLRQLQSCRTLIGALPRAQAPAEMLDRIKVSLERKTLLEEPALSSGSRAGARRLMARKLLAAAAMIALLGVLGAVIYQVVAPVPGSGVQPLVASSPQAARPIAPATTVADSGLSGRLEIRTASLLQTDSLVARAIKESGLSVSIEASAAGDTMVYRLVSTRDNVSRLLADLSRGWQHLGAATLRVESPDRDGAPVTIEAVTPEQAVSVVARTSTQESLVTARHYAVLNGMAAAMPGQEVLAMVSDDAALTRDMVAIDDMARLAGPAKDITLTPSQGETNVSFTIILLPTR